jgi:hypothetical protein
VDAVRGAIDSGDDGGGTDIYEALVLAVNEIDLVGGQRTVILMTDGLDGSGETPAALAQVAGIAKGKGITVNTIGFGKTGDVDDELLQRIATAGGGSYSFAQAANPEDLVAGFILAQTESTSTVLAQEIGSVGQDKTSDPLAVDVPDATGDMTTILHWPGSLLEPVLTDPDGVAVAAGYPGAVFDTAGIPAQVVISDPEPGAWTLAVHGTDTSTDQEPYFVVTSFLPIERPYVTTTISPPEAVSTGPAATTPDLAMALAAAAVPIGLFLIVLAIGLITGRKDPG